jgi:hypothetical protein
MNGRRARGIKTALAVGLVALGLAAGQVQAQAPTGALKAPPFGALQAAPTGALKAPPLRAIEAAPTSALKAPPFRA